MNDENLNQQQKQVEKNNTKAGNRVINDKPMTVKDWVITLLITSIPLLNLVMLFVWAFSDGENVNKANWAKANLIWIAISIVLAILLIGIIMSLAPSAQQMSTF